MLDRIASQRIVFLLAPYTLQRFLEGDVPACGGWGKWFGSFCAVTDQRWMCIIYDFSTH